VTPSPPPSEVPSLLRALQASDPGRPRVTWYGADGERVELSARVLDNWVAKTGNLLVTELDAGPGTTVRLDLPLHWRTVVWALATWAVGGELVAAEDDADVVVTADPAAQAGAGRLVVVALPALQRAVAALPPGALDYNAEVGQQPDVLMDDGDAVTVSAGSRSWPHAARVLVENAESFSWADLVSVLRADGSLVLTAPAVPARQRASIARQEQTDVRS
jgi:uncharacterized protein (TIGR03089 family)